MSDAASHISQPPKQEIEALIDRCLLEDFGVVGDLTADSIFDPDHTSTATVVARADGVIAGLDIGLAVFGRIGDGVVYDQLVDDGSRVDAMAALATLSGPTRTILAGERTCLNILGHLSGIATETRALVDAVEAVPGNRASIADTRKTTPGLRSFEKYAVRCGGGKNHRFGLHDAVMIKDNHIAAKGGVSETLAAIKSSVGHTVNIVVEVDRLGQIEDAIAGGADVILLDNLRGDDLRAGVQLIDGRAVAEASGGVDAASIAPIAAAGVDVISVGRITHSASRLDVALDY